MNIEKIIQNAVNEGSFPEHLQAGLLNQASAWYAKEINIFGCDMMAEQTAIDKVKRTLRQFQKLSFIEFVKIHEWVKKIRVYTEEDFL